ncbi:transglycosylase domain-containing protein [Corynebacterium mendelii]|uniref:Transglycosylase domain-containing protein n=1 Tax=Corynebacterium mendelii TaxID=2765362 RepID=A0A939DZM8_9CORY|nr:transglycosylase domain-containing protein [Corynebacterium mendelii]MBN9643770.1 transglycosylase domain-containing protein [Corynebacterium mendelii]
MTAATACVGVVMAASLSPFATLGGVAVARTQATMESNLKDLTDGTAPGVSTITDVTGAPIAWIYDQRRYQINGDQIAPVMKAAIVSIEDKRFFFHDGVDWQGTLRAMATNALHGQVKQGASTLDQQYVKNYLLLVDAKDKAEQAAATETSYARKLREMKMASDLEHRLSKDEILTRYLNIVPFGNGAFGVEAAAQTYFGVHASELTLPQAAMLAGMVQSSSYLDPYTRPEEVRERRDLVLGTMVDSGAISPTDAREAAAEPLGILPQPKDLPNGCIAAGNRGFFCDYVLDYLEKKGWGPDKLKKSSYTIRTTLDPHVQDVAHRAASGQADPNAAGVAAVMNILAPAEDSRRILAMTSSREYGLNQQANETVLAMTSNLMGSGAGSVFKIFTAAAAIEKGMGMNQSVAVPARVEVRGMGAGGAKNCPPETYCVENAGVYKQSMPLYEALAHSPNTTFVKMLEQVGVPDTVDMAVRLGLRDYTLPGSYNGTDSIADYVTKNNLGSFTLGPTAVNPLQLSNVAATLASHGVWCEPNPIDEITDATGAAVEIPQEPCEQVLDRGIADTLAQGLSHDTVEGTAADSAKKMGWTTPMSAKTGTTEAHFSASFLGFNSRFAAAPYVFNDGTVLKPLCTSPLRQCADGDLYGGMEPSRVWFSAAKQLEFATDGELPEGVERYETGATADDLPRVDGLSESDARTRLEQAGYKVTTITGPGNGIPKGRAVRATAQGPYLLTGDEINLVLSDGTRYVAPPPVYQPSTEPDLPAAPPPPPPAPDDGPRSLGDVINSLFGL